MTVGMTLEEIISQLGDWKTIVADTIEDIDKCKEDLYKYEKSLMGFSGIECFIDLSLGGLSKVDKEFERLIEEISEEVRPAHIDMLESLYHMCVAHRESCLDFKRDFQSMRYIKYLFNEDGEIGRNYKTIKKSLSDLYATMKSTMLTFTCPVTDVSIGSIRRRLSTYVGCKQHKKTSSSLPRVDKWEDIEMNFTDGHYVKIIIKGQVFNKDYKELGFLDNRTRRPNKQWLLLSSLAHNRGSIDWESGAAMANVKKQKQALSNRLKKVFNINDDPFLNYKKEGKAYKIKIKLTAE